MDLFVGRKWNEVDSDLPSRRSWEGREDRKNIDGYQELKYAQNPPVPLLGQTIDVFCTRIVNPESEKQPNTIADLVVNVSRRQDGRLDHTHLPKCHDNATDPVWRDFTDVGWPSRERDTLPKTNNGSSCNEHTQSMFGGESLEDGTDYDEQASDGHCHFSAE